MPDDENGALYSAVRGAFGKAGWAYREVTGRGDVIEAEFEAYHTKVCLHVQVFAEIHTVSAVAEAGFGRSEKEFLAKAAELLMRVNQTLNLGAFEMDYDGGKYFFRVSNVFSPGMYDEEIISSLVRAVVVEVDRVAPFVSVLGKEPTCDVRELLARTDLLPVIEPRE